jgi:hypothetical protein
MFLNQVGEERKLDEEIYLQKLKTGQVRGQAISYFVFALLFMRTYSVSIKSTEPFFRWYQAWIIPLPVFNITPWLMLILGVACLGFSIYLIMAMFRQSWTDRAVKITLSDGLNLAGC